jgi:hypothetical protein
MAPFWVSALYRQHWRWLHRTRGIEVVATALTGRDDTQRNDFKWAHVEFDGSPVCGKHRSWTLGRLFQKIDAIDPVE